MQKKKYITEQIQYLHYPYNLLIREETSGVKPYCYYVALQKEYRKIPDDVFDHPFIKRIYALSSLMIGIHNDIISLPKELSLEGDTMNLIKVLQQEKKISLTQAYTEALELHYIYLEEFLLLQKNLPSFDNYQDSGLRCYDCGCLRMAYKRHIPLINNGYVEGEYPS